MSAKKRRAFDHAWSLLAPVYHTFGRRQALLQIEEGATQDRLAMRSRLDREELTAIAIAVIEILDAQQGIHTGEGWR